MNGVGKNGATGPRASAEKICAGRIWLETSGSVEVVADEASAQKTGVIILAAGAATRFGAPKLALLLAGVPLVRRAALAALEVSRHVVVVTGAHCEEIEPLVADLAITRAYNPDWVLGMNHSIAHGLVQLCATAPDTSGALVLLADQVQVGVAELRQLLAAHAASPRSIVAANYRGEAGAPCLFPRSYFDKVMRLQDARGARAIMRRYAERVLAIDMPQAEVDVDTPTDYADVLAAYGL